MSDEIITVKIKQTSSNTTNEIKIAKDASIKELKDKVFEVTQFKPETQNLVYKGRILANDKTVSEYGLQNDHVIILVKKYVDEKKEEDKKESTSNNNNTSNTTNNTTSNTNTNTNSDPFSMFGNNNNTSNLGGFGGFGGFGSNQGGLGGNINSEQMNNLLSNPQYQQAMEQMLSNPQMLEQVLNNPQIKPMLDQNPQLRSMMSNPDFLRMMLNPNTMQSMMGMMGGNQGLNTNPFQNLNTNNNSSTSNTSNTSNTNTNPFGNFDISSLLGNTGNQNIGNYGFGGSSTQINPREAYKEQNQKLKDMGFLNDDLNFEVLAKTFGNVDAAVERLLGMFN